MYNFTLPDYNGGSIVNLMSSISNGFGKKHLYKELKYLSANELKKYKSVVLVVIDGLGYNYLIKQKKSFLYKNLKARMTTTFLSTTACAIPTFMTGYPPQQHALTGWDINLKEVGAITTILRFRPMNHGEDLSKTGFSMDSIMDIESFHKGFEGKSYFILNNQIAFSAFTNYTSKSVEVKPSSSIKNTFTILKKMLNENLKYRRFIYAYISEIDSIAHKEGIESKAIKSLFLDLDKKIQNLSKKINKDTLVIITADHGHVVIPEKKMIWVENIKGFKECLSMSISGEPRVRYCYIRPGKIKEFEKIAKEKLSKFCIVYKGEQIINDKLYGLFKPNKKLYDRVGDYVLIMKDNYILMEKLANYTPPTRPDIGHHGGVSYDEMFVPLVLITKNTRK